MYKEANNKSVIKGGTTTTGVGTALLREQSEQQHGSDGTYHTTMRKEVNNTGGYYTIFDKRNRYVKRNEPTTQLFKTSSDQPILYLASGQTRTFLMFSFSFMTLRPFTLFSFYAQTPRLRLL